MKKILLFFIGALGLSSLNSCRATGLVCAQRACSSFAQIVGYQNPCCLVKVVSQLAEQNQVDVAAKLICGLDFVTLANLLASLSVPEFYGKVLVQTVQTCPQTFDSFPSIFSLVQTDEEKDEAAIILKSALETTCQNIQCGADNATDTLAMILEKAVQVEGLLGRALCLMVQDCISVNCLCTIINSLIHDLMFDAADVPFQDAVCYFFSCMHLNACVSSEGAASLLASMWLNGFKNQGYECDTAVAEVVKTLCGCPEDFSALLTRAMELAQLDPSIAGNQTQVAALYAYIAAQLQAA